MDTETNTPELKSSALLLFNEFKTNPKCKIIGVFSSENAFLAKISSKIIFIKGINTPLNTQSARLLANNKIISKVILAQTVNTPDYLYYYKNESTDFESIKPQISNMFTTHKRLVAKPINGLKSKDVFLNITTLDEAQSAWNIIMNANYSGILYEEYKTGDIFRLLFLEGKLIAALRREKGFIIADGVNTIRDLIKLKNNYLDTQGRFDGRIKIDNDLSELLAKESLSIDSIPAKESKIFVVKDFSHLETITEVTKQVNNEVAEKLGKICTQLGLDLCGVDVISEDISNADKITTIEINKEPAIDFHHYPDYGTKINVAKLIVDKIVERS